MGSLSAIWPFHSQTFGYGFTDGPWIKVGDEYHMGWKPCAAAAAARSRRHPYPPCPNDST